MILVIGGKNQGKTDFVRENFGDKRVLNRFHLLVRERMTEGKAENIINEALSFDVVISDEIGGGIVPVDRFEREWRETTGRALCDLARQADAVYRLCAGIPIRIK